METLLFDSKALNFNDVIPSQLPHKLIVILEQDHIEASSALAEISQSHSNVTATLQVENQIGKLILNNGVNDVLVFTGITGYLDTLQHIKDDSELSAELCIGGYVKNDLGGADVIPYKANSSASLKIQKFRHEII